MGVTVHLTYGFSKSSLVYAAADRKHRPLSHPLVLNHPRTERGFYDHIAQRIRDLRRERGWTQRELGARVGVSGVSVCHWERGDTNPTAWNIDRLERVFAAQVRP